MAAVIDERYAAEADGWRKRRLLAVKLVAKGEYTSEEVADLCGVSRPHLFVWLRRVREEGLDALLARDKPGPREGTRRGVKPEVIRELGERLAAHFAHVPGVSLEWDASYLRDLAASDPAAIHVVIRDQAGFHLRDGDPRLPAQVRVVDLPP